MPGVYREKVCPTCKKKHRKRGPYCSQSCHSKVSPRSEKQRENMRRVSHEYKQTPEGRSNLKQFAEKGTVYKADEYAVNIPDTTTLEDYSEFLEGFEKGEKW